MEGRLEYFDTYKETANLWESSKPRLEVLEIMEGWLKMLNDKWDEIPNNETSGYYTNDDYDTDEEDDYVIFLASRIQKVEWYIDYFFPETIGKPSRKKAYLESLWEKAFDRE